MKQARHRAQSTQKTEQWHTSSTVHRHASNEHALAQPYVEAKHAPRARIQYLECAGRLRRRVRQGRPINRVSCALAALHLRPTTSAPRDAECIVSAAVRQKRASTCLDTGMALVRAGTEWGAFISSAEPKASNGARLHVSSPHTLRRALSRSPCRLPRPHRCPCPNACALPNKAGAQPQHSNFGYAVSMDSVPRSSYTAAGGAWTFTDRQRMGLRTCMLRNAAPSRTVRASPVENACSCSCACAACAWAGHVAWP